MIKLLSPVLFALASGFAGAASAQTEVRLKRLPSAAYELAGSFAVDASTEAVWAVLTDYQDIPSFVSSMRSSRVLERRPDGSLLVEAVWRGEVSAVFAETDLAAAAVVQALSRAGLSVPGDVSLVGFDDILGAEYIAGGLSTVYHPAAEMAAEGIHTLMKRLQGAEPSRQLLSPRLIVRRSTRRRSGP